MTYQTDNIYGWARRYGVPAHALTELLDIVDPSRPHISGSHDSEAAVQAALRVSAAERGSSLWRNNNGAAVDETGRHIRYGLGNDSKKLSKVWKSADLIGITPVTSTQAGQTFGVFTAVEVKAPGWVAPKNERERAQAAFLSTVRTMGGIGMFAQSTADYEGIFSDG